MIRVGAFLIAALFIMGCPSTGHRVRRIDLDTQLATKATSLTQPHLYYALPRSVVVVSVPVKKTSWAAPVCADTANQPEANQIGIDLTKMVPRHKIEFGDPIIELRTEPDPKQVFAVEITKSYLHKMKHQFEFSERGLLTSTSLESENVTVAWGTKALESATKLVPSLLGFGLPTSDKAKAASDAKKVCKDKVDTILQLRREIRGLVGGQRQTNGTPRDAVEFMLKELRALEAAELEAFVGKQQVIESTVQCEYVPQPALPSPWERPTLAVETVSLFGRGKTGLHEAPAPKAQCRLSGDLMVPGEAADESLTLEIVPDAEPFIAAIAQAKGKEPTNADGGLRYRLPGSALLTVLSRVTIQENGKPVDKLKIKAATRRLIPQFGVVATLPGDKDLSDVSKKLSIAFHGELGMLKTLGMEGASVDPGVLGTAADLGKTLADEEAKRRTTEAGKEVADLEAKKKKLELEKAIRDLEATLASPVQ